jgi:hypothetical protein
VEIVDFNKLCSIWDDVRTYLTSSIDPKEKAALLAAIAHFKKKEGERT